MKTTWILIANSSKARLFEAEKFNRNLKLLKEFNHPQSRAKVLDLISDSAGSYTKSVSNTPLSSFEEKFGPKEQEADRFAHELAQKLNEGRTKNLYTTLIVIAPSHFNGLLNKHVNEQVRNKITHNIIKDYTKIKEHDLPKYLNGKLSHAA